ncbi:unnamed protein product [Agarophyton chilense]|eukprot:gb/GEZJ01001372.1/.p1 GENE.gb/GEZJ01001372.1/~~gb/GEZJ01001372.1/.p1  ORF type:complete len:542 (-),score=57.78 gb/GEZJ01001372.1/:1632-3257(-)
MTSEQPFTALSADPPSRQHDAIPERAQLLSLHASAPQLTFHILILNNSRDSVLASVISDSQLRLPFVRPPLHQLYYMNVPVPRMYQLHHWEVESCALEHFIHAQLHIRFHLLQTIGYYPSDFTRRSRHQPLESHVLLLGVIEDFRLSDPQLRWVKRRQLSRFKWANILQGVCLESQIDTMLQNINHNPLLIQSAPWLWNDGVNAVHAWARRALKEQQLIPITPFHLICKSGECCVFRCTVRRFNQNHKQRKICSAFDVFIKAVRSPSQEPLRTASISTLLSSFVPRVLAVDGKCNAMIQKSAGTPLDASIDLSALTDTLYRMQISSINHVSELTACGLQTLDSRWLSANFDSILRRPAIVSMQRYPDVQRDIIYIRSKLALVRELCEEVLKVSIPNVLVHGDLRIHNIASVKCDFRERICFFDWASSFIGHPFYDLRTLLENQSNLSLMNINKNREEHDTEPHVTQYLKSWMPQGSLADLRHVYDHMDILRFGIELHLLTQLYDFYKDIERRKLIPRIHSEIRGLVIMLEDFATSTVESTM